MPAFTNGEQSSAAWSVHGLANEEHGRREPSAEEDVCRAEHAKRSPEGSSWKKALRLSQRKEMATQAMASRRLASIEETESSHAKSAAFRQREASGPPTDKRCCHDKICGRAIWSVETDPSLTPGCEPSAHTCGEFLDEFGTEGG